MGTRDARGRRFGVSYYDFLDMREAAKSFSDISLMGQPPFNVSEQGTSPERYNGAYVSANTFRLIGAQALLGRGFIAEDDLDGATPVVVLGCNIWQSRYAGDKGVLGKTIKVNDLLATVVGVMPQGMQFPRTRDLWLPLGQATVNRGQSRQVRNYQVIARLADGVTIPQARSELTTDRDAPCPRLPTDQSRHRADDRHLQRARERAADQARVLVADGRGRLRAADCLQQRRQPAAGALGRAREGGRRSRLARREPWRVIRQLLVESVMLSLIGGLFGLPLAYAGIRLFDSLTQDVGKPYWMVFSMDPIVLLVLLRRVLRHRDHLRPGAGAARVEDESQRSLKEGGRSGSSGDQGRRWTSGLLVVQVALTLVLLAGAGFMMRSFLVLYRLDLGFDTPRLLTMQINLNDRKYPTPEQRNNFARRLTERLRGIGALADRHDREQLPARRRCRPRARRSTAARIRMHASQQSRWSA